jgi:hypothetical protein
MARHGGGGGEGVPKHEFSNLMREVEGYVGTAITTGFLYPSYRRIRVTLPLRNYLHFRNYW